ncbi:MAG TPA: ABC transporter ATP-binding protein [Ignisphaera sp.]|nr:ABC transporter ATP-binding protein [Ignisphaera sp.]
MEDLSSNVILSIKNLKVYYYSPDGVVKAVDGVDLDIEEGEILALVGESGCGKTTLGYAILNLVPPPGKIVEGSIVFKGRDLVKLSREELEKIRGKEITMVFQDPMASLNPVFRIGDQLLDVVMHKLGVDKDEAYRIVINALKAVRLPNPEEIMKRYPHELSGGMLQRVVIAMAIAPKPSLIIADEPTTALDVTIQAAILKLMAELMRELKTTTILITHNMGVVAESADRVAVMYAGTIVEVGNVYRVFKNPLHPYTEGLLSCVPRADIDIPKLSAIGGEVPSLIDPPPGCRFSTRCPYAKSVCRHRRPPMIEVEPRHFVSCWRYVER